MGCGKNNNDFHCKSGVGMVVRAIKDIKDNEVVEAEEFTECTSCFTEPLGSMVSPARRDPVDTRVFVLSTADGTPFYAFLTDEFDACVSIYFRVEEVFDNWCATLRVLVPGHRDSNNQFAPINLVSGGDKCCIDLKKVCEVDRFRASGDFITVDLSCFCAVQCIADVNLGLFN
jgi:hypothetical protein